MGYSMPHDPYAAAAYAGSYGMGATPAGAAHMGAPLNNSSGGMHGRTGHREHFVNLPSSACSHSLRLTFRGSSRLRGSWKVGSKAMLL